MSIQTIFESYQTYWYAPFILLPFIRYCQFLFTTVIDWDQEIERFPTPREAWNMFWHERDVLVFDFLWISIVIGVLLYIAPFFIDQMA